MSPTTISERLAEYPLLPDDSVIPDRVAAKVLGISVWTLRRENPIPPVQVSERRRGRRVGDIRAKVRGEAATSPLQR
jgi:hypothetical protein